MERMALLVILLAACHGVQDDTAADTDADTDTDTDADTDVFPLEGIWDDAWGGVHTITQQVWTMVYPSDTSVFHVETITLEDAFLVARNDVSNQWYPELYSRFDWTVLQGDPWYCQVAWDAADAATAAAAAAADPSDPATAGCGGFPWNHLVPHSN